MYCSTCRRCSANDPGCQRVHTPLSIHPPWRTLNSHVCPNLHLIAIHNLIPSPPDGYTGNQSLDYDSLAPLSSFPCGTYLALFHDMRMVKPYSFSRSMWWASTSAWWARLLTMECNNQTAELSFIVRQSCDWGNKHRSWDECIVIE